MFPLHYVYIIFLLFSTLVLCFSLRQFLNIAHLLMSLYYKRVRVVLNHMGEGLLDYFVFLVGIDEDGDAVLFNFEGDIIAFRRSYSVLMTQLL